MGSGGVFLCISYGGAQIALEAGNSPKVIFSNYRELVEAGERDEMVRHPAGNAGALMAAAAA